MIRLASAMLLAVPLLAGQQLLEVYADKAFLTQRFEVGSGKFETNLPEFVTLNALHVKSSCQVNQKNLGAPVLAQSPYLSRLEEAKKAYEEANRALHVQDAKERLLERVSLNESSVDGMGEEAQKFGKIVEELLRERVELERIVKEKKEHYEALQTDPMAQKIKPLEMILSCDGPSLLELRYPIKSLEVQRKNRFEGDMDEGNMRVEQNIFLTHKLGTSLEGVTLHLYGHAYNKRLNPPAFNPWYIYEPFPEPKRMMSMSAPMNESMQVTDAQVGNTQSKQFWEISGLNLPSNETVQVPLDRQSVFVDFDTFVDGYSQGMAYIRGKFTPQKPINGAQSEFILGGALVGGGWHESFEEKKESFVYFGKNDYVGVEKTLRDDYTTTDASKNTQTTQVIYEYIFTNRDHIAHEIVLSERLPISKKGDVSVKALGDEPDSTTAQGEVFYKLQVKPGEKSSVRFGYSITKPLPKE